MIDPVTESETAGVRSGSHGKGLELAAYPFLTCSVLAEAFEFAAYPLPDLFYSG